MSRGGSRQDYIARVRYQNDLPPPPCPPKLIDIPIDTAKLTSHTYLSDLARKQEPNMFLDMDLGMPLDMTALTGIFDHEDESSVYPQDPPPVLDPKDSVLLREPGGSGPGASKPQSTVAFLRRTEYISSEAVRQKATREPSVKKDETKFIDPEAQLRAVENTFEAANMPLEMVKHPTKKHLKAVDAYPIMPDFKQMDLTYLAVKMIGSAALSHDKKKLPSGSTGVSLFRPTSLSNDEWMSFFIAKEDDARRLKRKLDDPSDKPEDGSSDGDDVYRFTHYRDYEMELVQPTSQFDEIALSIDEEHKTAVYVPIAGRTKLKHRRVVEAQRALVNQHNVAAIDLSLREVTADEGIQRDNARSEYDPISYTALPTEQADEGEAEAEAEPDQNDDGSGEE